jgi:outer membrane lipoprotein SlyB
MRNMHKTHVRMLPLALVAAVSLLAGCGPQHDAQTMNTRTIELAPDTSAARKVATAPRGELGTVTAVVPIQTTEKPSGAGAVIGGVLGAAVGNQIGDGNGRKVATVVGAVGGAKIGHEVERDRNTRVTGYRIDIRFDDGRKTSITRSQPDAFATGQRVKMANGEVTPA